MKLYILVKWDVLFLVSCERHRAPIALSFFKRFIAVVKLKPEKLIQAQTGFVSMTLHCIALSTELSSHLAAGHIASSRCF